MAGWGRVVAGVVLGVAGTVYATNEEVRKNLPKAARDLPESVRRRYKNAVEAAREASTTRRQEILRDLEERGGSQSATRPLEEPGVRAVEASGAPVTAPVGAGNEETVADGLSGSEGAPEADRSNGTQNAPRR